MRIETSLDGWFEPREMILKEPTSGREFYHSPKSDLRFLGEAFRLDPTAEQARYELHQNRLDDPKYFAFNEPLARIIAQHIFPGSHGLDFGCGKAPILGHWLEKHGYRMSFYDPYFRAQEELLKQKYDFIFAVEVIEHLYQPWRELAMLRAMIHPGGSLFFMTHIYTPEINFESWYYRKDPTHVVFYSRQALEFIKNELTCSEISFFGDRIVQFHC